MTGLNTTGESVAGTYSFGQQSRNELVGVHPLMVLLAERTIATSPVDFSLHDGLRTETEQREYVRRGVSKTMASKHMRQRDGFGHAFDAVPYINGKLRWEWRPLFHIAAAAALALKAINKERQERGETLFRVRWGGVWDRELAELGATAAEMEKAVNAYVARRRAQGKTAFIDGPHFELIA